MNRVVLYGRPQCCLCEQAQQQLEQLQKEHAFELEIVNIETNDLLHKRYLERIPVITVNGSESFEYFLDKLAFIDLLD